MSTIELGRPSTRRVRDQAREAMALMAFSAVTSVCLAAVLMVLANLPTLG